ncbi:TonB-dependent receptor [Rugamonas sp.]|uniref:TonB-dependent receptor n=1 Tax=Rugamonas sp. TaxID=1926287 RepID=UPI0025F8BFA2|nr:TonB-dependent receptor [Rugamonas sp.]
MKSIYAPFVRRAPLSPLNTGAILLLATCMALSVQQAWAADPAAADDAQPMAVVVVSGSGPDLTEVRSPATTATVTARQLEETNNVMNVEDALKYLPSILVRKRFDGDTQAPVATRTTGVNSSARSLVMADGVMLSALVNNNNGNGSPRWFMVAPEEIDSVDVMYGPYSAAYAGNSYGAVIQLNTRMPTRFEASVKVNAASQHFGLYGTSGRYGTQDLGATFGNRDGALAWFVSATHLDSHSQPITFGTLAQSTKAAAPGDAVIGGAYADRNRSNGAIQVLGAGNITHTVQDSVKIKLAYDLSRDLSAVYTLGYWHNIADAGMTSYLRDAAGAPYYGGASGNVNIGGKAYSASAVAGQFSANSSDQQHWMQSLDLKTRHGAVWDWDAIVSNYHYDKDVTRTSTGLFPAGQRGGAGRTADAGGTGWSTVDLNGSWHPDGASGAHVLNFGLHGDQFQLVSPTYASADWTAGDHASLYSDSRGQTRTEALWLQDRWRVAPALTATLGARYERWRAFDGYNYALAGGKGYAVYQPQVERSGLSPKAALNWKIDPQWQATASYGKALRFPTVGELYQNVQTGTTYTQANPNLKPENVQSGELAIERNGAESKLRVSLFEEKVSDALISQSSLIAGYATPVSYTQNVDRTRQRGIELVGERQNALIRGLDLNGSLTYVDARILGNSGYVATVAGATSVGKHTPYVPAWRATAMATYRPADKWAITLAARYSGKQYGTVDNSDVNGHSYTGFDSFVVADVRVHYQISRQWSAAAGVDNLNNRNYFLYHPFPQRTFFTELKFNY